MKTLVMVLGIINIVFGALAILGSMMDFKLSTMLGSIYWVFVGVVTYQASKLLKE